MLTLLLVPIVTTTAAAIRDAMISQLEASTTPTSDTSVLFRKNQAHGDFREWCQANPQASYRRFAITRLYDEQRPEAMNLDVREVVGFFQVLVGYPSDYRYGGDALRDRDDVVDEDFYSIENAIGSDGGYQNISNCAVLFVARDFEEYDGVGILAITYEIHYYRAD